MNNTSASAYSNTQVFQNNQKRSHPTPSHAIMMKGKARRKLAMIALSFALTAALGCIVLIIGSSVVEASSLPTFTVANALSAKQDAGIASIATASVTLIAFGALAIISGKR